MNTRRLLFLLGLTTTAATLAALATACLPQGGNYEPCARGDEGCECELDEADDPLGETCALPPADDDDLDWSWEDDDEDIIPDDNDEDDDNGSTGWRFVMLEDLTGSASGDSPGADIDAIAIEKEGRRIYASGVADFNIGGDNNAFTDPTQALGAPDSQCTRKNFVALGGRNADGYLIVEFSDADEDVTIESGDRIIVYELGATVCPNQPSWDDDPAAVSVSVSAERDTFQELFVIGDGQNVVAVP